MSLQSLYQRFVNRKNGVAVTEVPVEFAEPDVETMMMRPPYEAPPQKHSGYIAMVGFTPGDLLTDGLLRESRPDAITIANNTAIRSVDLPTNTDHGIQLPYELEYADLILYVLDTRREMSSNHMRWLARIQGLNVPMVVLLNGADDIHRRTLPRLVTAIEQRLNQPVIPVHESDQQMSREQLVTAVYHKSPRLAAMLSIHSPLLRPILAEQLMSSTALTSMELDYLPGVDAQESPLADAQVRLIRQINAVYGKGSRLSLKEYKALNAVVGTVTHYTTNIVGNLPLVEDERRDRLSFAVSTLLVGYIAMVYHGETPPEIRKQVLPQIWRLYRASGQMADD